jgi:hypothetical protein
MLALHEAMHNKLAKGNQMHTGFQWGAGALATPGNNWTSQNVHIMALHLADEHPQITTGCQRMTDPMRGIL